MDIIVRIWNPIKEEYLDTTEEGVSLNGEFVLGGGYFGSKHKLKTEEIVALEFELATPKRDESNKRIFENDIVEITDYSIIEFAGGEDLAGEFSKRAFRVLWDGFKFSIELLNGVNEFYKPLVFDFPESGVGYKIIGKVRG